MADDRFLLPVARIAFPELAKPSSFNEGALEYGVTLLWPSDTDLSDLKNRIRGVLVARWPSLSPAQKAALGFPLKDGNLKAEWGGFEGSVYAKAKTKLPPSLFGRRLDPATGKLETLLPQVFYAGCYVKAYVSLYAYDQKGNKGVRLTLSALQFWDDGEPLALLVPDGARVFGAPEAASDESFGGQAAAGTEEQKLNDWLRNAMK